MIRLIIADDHQIVRLGLRMTFEGTNIAVVAEATTGEEAIGVASAVEADVMLLDVNMPDGDGFEVLQRLRFSPPAIVMYSMHDREHYVRRSRELGACGYLTKHVSAQQLVDAIQAASEGGQYWDSSLHDSDSVSCGGVDREFSRPPPSRKHFL